MARSSVVVERERTHGLSRLRLFSVLTGLYVAQAIPVYLFGTAALSIMREEGVSRSAIGLVSLVLLPGLLRFIWAPLVDRVKPFAQAHRASWIGLTQTGIVLGLVVLSFVEPRNFVTFIAIGFVIAILLSVNDIAVDGYAVKHLSPEDRPTGNAIQGGAVAAGVLIGGTGALVLYHYATWQITVLTIAAISLLPIATAFAMREEKESLTVNSAPRASLMTFFRRPEARRILAVALLYRASEGLMNTMEGPYLVDNGVALDTIGYLTGAGAASAGLAGSGLAAFLLMKLGSRATLALLGLLRTLCFAWFALHALDIVAGHPLLFGAAGFNTFIRYMEIVAVYSLFMSVCSKEQPGTDFTILSCAQVIVYLIGAALAGFLADKLGYAALFAGATAISLVSVMGTYRILRQSKGS